MSYAIKSTITHTRRQFARLFCAHDAWDKILPYTRGYIFAVFGQSDCLRSVSRWM